MPIYHVRQYRDAWQIYTATVEAPNPEEALLKAKNDDIVGGQFAWKDDGVEIMDDRHMEIFDATESGERDYDSDVLATDFP